MILDKYGHLSKHWDLKNRSLAISSSIKFILTQYYLSAKCLTCFSSFFFSFIVQVVQEFSRYTL